MAVQARLGADIQMALDVCPALPAPRAGRRGATERTHALGRAGPGRLPRRGRRAPSPPTRCSSASCRAASSSTCGTARPAALVDLGFDGYAIGGLSVGETRAEMVPAVAAATAALPADRPRYLMGVGDPAGMRRGDRRRAWTSSTACCPPASPATAPC